jgi:GGDEF domain-containing protein
MPVPAMFFVDPDGFQTINDRQRHATAHKLLLITLLVA